MQYKKQFSHVELRVESFTHHPVIKILLHLNSVTCVYFEQVLLQVFPVLRIPWNAVDI